MSESAAPPVHKHVAVEMELDADARCATWDDSNPAKTRLYFAENDSFQTYVFSKMSDSEVTSPAKETAIPRKTILDGAFNKANGTACFLVTKPEEVDSDDSNSDRDDDTPIPYVLVQYDARNKVVSKKELFRITYAESLLAIRDNGDVFVYSEPEGKKPYIQIFDGSTLAIKDTKPCGVRNAYRMYVLPGEASMTLTFASPKGLYVEDVSTGTRRHFWRQKYIEDFTVLPDGRVVYGLGDNSIRVLAADFSTELRQWTSSNSVDTSLNPEAADAELDDEDSDASDDDELVIDDSGDEDDDAGKLEDEDTADAKTDEDTMSSSVSVSTVNTDDLEEEPDVFKQIRDIFSSEHFVFVRFVSDDVFVYKISDL